MQIDFTGRNLDIRENVRDFTAGKLEKIEKFVQEPAEAHLILEIEKNRRIAELQVKHKFGTLVAKEEAENLLDAIQAVVEKVEKQARRAHKKSKGRKRRASSVKDVFQHWPLEVLDATSFHAGGDGGGPRVVKTTRLPIKPMTIDEAALQLEDSKNDFFVFRDSSSDRVSVLYRRRDQNYGLIAPEP